MKVSTDGDMDEALILRPKGFATEEAKQGKFYATADNNPDFIISWGG